MIQASFSTAYFSSAKPERSAVIDQMNWDDGHLDGHLGVVNRPPHRSVDADALRVTLNPFENDEDFDRLSLGTRQEMELEADELHKECDFETDFHLTFQHDDDDEEERRWWNTGSKDADGADTFQKFEWDDVL